MDLVRFEGVVFRGFPKNTTPFPFPCASFPGAIFTYVPVFLEGKLAISKKRA